MRLRKPASSNAAKIPTGGHHYDAGDQIETALAYLSMIDPEAFEIALTAVVPAVDESEDDEPIPLCRTCGAPVGIFPELALSWRHFRGDAAAAGAHQTYDPDHAPKVAWYLPHEAAEEF